MKTLIITPACNEEKHLSSLIESMVKQSRLPCEWIIVDDGSIDNTSNLIQTAATQYDWITYLRKEKKTKRAPGRSVVEAFYYGFKNRKKREYDIFIKLDADLILPNNYLEKIVLEFKNNSKLGMCGGVCVIEEKDDYIIEKETNLDHIRGAIKAYRRQCFYQIGGLVNKMGWDTIDEHHARFKDWEVLVLLNLKVIHQRSTNQEYGLLKAAFRNGIMLYSIRLDVFLLFLNCIKKSLRRPYFVLGFMMFFGYFNAFFTGHEKIIDKELGKFIRKYRYNKLLERIYQK